MKFIPEQVVGLRKAILEKRKNIEGYRDYLDDNRTTSPDDINRLRIGDSFTENSFDMDRRDYNRFTDILEDIEVIDNPCFDHVDVGTRFTALYDDEKEPINLTLVESAQFISLAKGFVSISSPFGAAVRGAKEGEHCSFKVNGRNIGFTVTKIDKDLNNYLRTICSVQKHDRSCKAALKEVHDAIESGDLERQEELRALTHSQVVLLKTEYERLSRELMKNKDKAVSARTGCIKHLLETRKVTYPDRNSDTIGVGSLFSVKLVSKDDELVFENVELINCAVSDEYSFEYMERIGAIGHAVVGLREGDSFKVRIGNKHYTGVVYGINNTYGSILERSNRR